MRKMPHAVIWQQRLSKLYDDQKAKSLILSAQKFYEYYSAQHPTEASRVNHTVLMRRILPGLSIYKALLEENNDQQKVFAEIDNLFRAAFFTRMMRGIRLMNDLPNPFGIVKQVLKMMTRNEYGPRAQEIVEDSADCFAINVYRCFILDTLVKHNAKELTASYCNTDDWLAEALPKISWERTKTLGRGGAYCDFRWCRIKSPTTS